MQVPRRKFIKFVTFGTATSMLAGKVWKRDVIAYCFPEEGQPDCVFKVKLSEFPALLENWGSVRLGINPVRQELEPYPDGQFYPILINRDDQGNFYVLDCECQHAGCVVPTLAGTINCPCHGSAYAIDGSVVQGPSIFPLKSYQFEYDGNDTLSIHIPCWGVQVKIEVLPGGGNSRIRLDFTMGGNVPYEVNFRERAEDPWTKVSFSLSPEGPADEFYVSNYGGSDVSVYLDRTTATGYYAISTQISEV